MTNRSCGFFGALARQNAIDSSEHDEAPGVLAQLVEALVETPSVSSPDELEAAHELFEQTSLTLFVSTLSRGILPGSRTET